MVNKTTAISVSWRLHFKGRQAINKPLVVPKELKWTVDWGGFCSVSQRQLCWKCVVSKMAGAAPCVALKEKKKLHWQEEKNDWVLKEQNVNVAGVCPRYCRADMKISLQKRNWGVKQMVRKQSGALIELCSILDTLETYRRVWCWGDGSLGRVLSVQAWGLAWAHNPHSHIKTDKQKTVVALYTCKPSTCGWRQVIPQNSLAKLAKLMSFRFSQSLFQNVR